LRHPRMGIYQWPEGVPPRPRNSELWKSAYSITTKPKTETNTSTDLQIKEEEKERDTTTATTALSMHSTGLLRGRERGKPTSPRHPTHIRKLGSSSSLQGASTSSLISTGCWRVVLAQGVNYYSPVDPFKPKYCICIHTRHAVRFDNRPPDFQQNDQKLKLHDCTAIGARDGLDLLQQSDFKMFQPRARSMTFN